MAEQITLASLNRKIEALRVEFKTLLVDYKARNPGYGRPTCPHCHCSVSPHSKSCPTCEKPIPQ